MMLDENLTLDIYKISRCTHNFYARELQALGITMGQFPFLLTIAENDGISQEKVSCLNQISKSTTATIVKQLLDSGLVTREIAPEDKRNFRLHATSAGQSLVPRIHEAIRHCHALITADLTDIERMILAALLERVLKHAQELPQE